MTQSSEMSQDRQNALRLMAMCGWQHNRIDRYHEFTKRSEGDFWGYPMVKVSHKNLCLEWAICHCGHKRYKELIGEARAQFIKEIMP